MMDDPADPILFKLSDKIRDLAEWTLAYNGSFSLADRAAINRDIEAAIRKFIHAHNRD
jgi:hypothetical protein